jgi:hypothetical protein
MDHVKTARAEPMVDGSGPQSEGLELAPSHHAVLSSRKLRHPPIRRPWRCVSLMRYFNANFIHLLDFIGLAVVRDTHFVSFP